MIVELNTALLNASESINSNQLIFLSLVLKKKKKNNQDVNRLVSLLNDDDIPNLIKQGLVTSIERGKNTIYKPTEKLLDLVKPKKEFFDLFYEMYPVYVTRKDGAKSFLRTNVNKCRNMYNQLVGNSQAMANHLNKCLDFEINKKMKTGSMCFMKTMWRWLVDHTWEESEQEMTEEIKQEDIGYGNELI